MMNATQINSVNTGALAEVGSSSPRNIADIILAVGIAAMDANDDKIRLFYGKVEQNNRQMANYNKAMSAANNYTQSGGELNDNEPKMSYTDPQTGETKDISLKEFMDINGINYPKTGKLSKEEWNIVVTNLKSGSDTLGSTNQIDMMKLQSVMNKQNEMTQMVSNNISKLNQISMSIIGNLR